MMLPPAAPQANRVRRVYDPADENNFPAIARPRPLPPAYTGRILNRNLLPAFNAVAAPDLDLDDLESIEIQS